MKAVVVVITVVAAVLAVGSPIRLGVLGLVLVVWAAIVAWLLTRRGSKVRTAPAMTRSFVRGTAGVSAMNDQFQKSFAALKSTRPMAFTDLPWYLVIGAPSSGKTSLMEESGLSFASFGAGSPHANGPTRSCDWWYTEEALYLDVSGRPITDAAAHDEFALLIDLISQVRPERAINGIVVTVSLPELIGKDEVAVNAHAQQIRDRLNEVVRTLHLDLPVYVVFTKSDMIGGFKDFFAGLPRAERDQVFGCTVPWQPGHPVDALGLFQREAGALLPILGARRLNALGGPHTQAEQFKIFQFPHQFAAVQKWMGDFLGALFRPSQNRESPALRGFYFTSAQPTPKAPAEASRSASVPAAPAPKDAPPSQPSLEGSIFIMPNAPRAVAAVGEAGKGIFIKELLSRQLLGDRGLVQVSRSIASRRRTLRLASGIASIAIFLVVWLWLVQWCVTGRGLITQVVAAARQVNETLDKEGGKMQPNLVALNGLRVALSALDHHHSGAAASARAQGQALYYAQLKRYFLAPLGDRLRTELEHLRSETTKSQTTHDQLYDLFRAYQMITDHQAQHDRDLLERVATVDHRWTTGLQEAGKASSVDAQEELLGGNQLGYFLDHRTSSSGWEIPIDRPLLERVSTELGDTLWPRQSYEDIITGLQSTVAAVNRETVISGQYKELLASDYAFPSLFTQSGWDDAVASAVGEKTEELFRRYQSLKIDKPRDRIAERLRAQYLSDYNRHWLALLASIHPVACKDLKEAALALRALTGPQSPYRELIRTVWRNLSVRLTAAELRPLSADDNGKWLDDALSAVGEFVDAVDKFANATDAGKRSLDLVRLQALQGVCDGAWAKVGNALKIIESPERRTAVSTALENLVVEAQRALTAEITQEQDRLWAERVAKPFAEQLAGHYPFDLAAKAEASLASFSHLFNPKNGLFVAASQPIEELRKIRLVGRELLPVNRDYERMVDRAKDIREALYPDGQSAITAPFFVTLVQREGVKDVRLAVGSDTFGLYDRPDRRSSMTWKEGDGDGAKLSINVVSDQWLTQDHGGSPWGLLRLLRDGSPMPRSQGGIICSWSFSSPSVGKSATFNAGALIEAPAFEKVLMPEFFVGLLCPDHIGR